MIRFHPFWLVISLLLLSAFPVSAFSQSDAIKYKPKTELIIADPQCAAIKPIFFTKAKEVFYLCEFPAEVNRPVALLTIGRNGIRENALTPYVVSKIPEKENKQVLYNFIDYHYQWIREGEIMKIWLEDVVIEYDTIQDQILSTKDVSPLIEQIFLSQIQPVFPNFLISALKYFTIPGRDLSVLHYTHDEYPILAHYTYVIQGNSYSTFHLPDSMLKQKFSFRKIFPTGEALFYRASYNPNQQQSAICDLSTSQCKRFQKLKWVNSVYEKIPNTTLYIGQSGKPRRLTIWKEAGSAVKFFHRSLPLVSSVKRRTGWHDVRTLNMGSSGSFITHHYHELSRPGVKSNVYSLYKNYKTPPREIVGITFDSRKKNKKIYHNLVTSAYKIENDFSLKWIQYKYVEEDDGVDVKFLSSEYRLMSAKPSTKVQFPTTKKK